MPEKNIGLTAEGLLDIQQVSRYNILQPELQIEKSQAYDTVLKAFSRTEIEMMRERDKNEAQRIWTERAAYEVIMQRMDGGLLQNTIAQMPFAADLLHDRYVPFYFSPFSESDRELYEELGIEPPANNTQSLCNAVQEQVPEADTEYLQQLTASELLQFLLNTKGSEPNSYRIHGERQLCVTNPIDSAELSLMLSKGLPTKDERRIDVAPDGFIFETYVTQDTDNTWATHEPIRRVRFLGIAEYTAGKLNLADKAKRTVEKLMPIFEHTNDSDIRERRNALINVVLGQYFGITKPDYRIVTQLAPQFNLLFMQMAGHDVSRVADGIKDSNIITTLASITFPPPQSKQEIVRM